MRNYAWFGVDCEKALATLTEIPISIHCRQGDDVLGFDQAGALSGGIQATGNYPGRARNLAELTQDIDKMLSFIPGRHRLNLHASYAIMASGEKTDRDQPEPRHFQPRIDFAETRGLGLDFNPTLFAHPLAQQATLSHETEAIRQFWIRHCQACIKIAEAFATDYFDASINTASPPGRSAFTVCRKRC